MRKIVGLFLLLVSSVPLKAEKRTTSPEQAFGFKPGADRKLADWTELTAYFKKLSTESDRIRYEEVGKTTEGRPFITVTISSPENLAHLARYQEIQKKLADPRTTSPEQAKKLISEGKTVLVVTYNVHSTEIASSQSATEFAYQLATGDTPRIRSILHNVIVVLVPSLNPDGQQLVVDWYKKTALEIGQTGKQGVLIHGVYDFWSPLRDYIALHNGLRVLSESSSVDIASPINIPFEKLDHGIGYDAKVATWNFPDPWKGGEWHLSDIVDYQLDAFFSIANNAAEDRERYLNNFYQIGVRAVNPQAGRV